jgi:hypothetical protein
MTQAHGVPSVHLATETPAAPAGARRPFIDRARRGTAVRDGLRDIPGEA